MVVEQVGVVALLPAVVPAGLPYPAPAHLTPPGVKSCWLPNWSVWRYRSLLNAFAQRNCLCYDTCEVIARSEFFSERGCDGSCGRTTNILGSRLSSNG